MENRNIHILLTNHKFPVVDKRCQNIYITSNEEIKEGEYNVPSDFSNISDISKTSKEDLEVVNEKSNGYRKIILTTDQDLIKDGVQAIDDEFLEWFVNNPDCKKVEVLKNECNYDEYRHYFAYKIIIPSRDPKQKWDINTCRYWDMEIGCEREKCICENQEPKQDTVGKQFYETADMTISVIRPNQETIEEAAEKEFPLIDTEWCRTGACEEENLQLLGHRRSFIKGVKWQQEQDKNKYSAEEVKKISLDFFYHWWNSKGNNTEQGFEEWFENYKEFKNK